MRQPPLKDQHQRQRHRREMFSVRGMLLIYEVRVVLDFAKLRKLVRSLYTLLSPPAGRLVWPRLCLRLPSGLKSPTTPLFGGLKPPSYHPCQVNWNKTLSGQPGGGC